MHDITKMHAAVGSWIWGDAYDLQCNIRASKNWRRTITGATNISQKFMHLQTEHAYAGINTHWEWIKAMAYD